MRRLEEEEHGVPEGALVLDQIVITRYVSDELQDPIVTTWVTDSIGVYDIYGMLGMAMGTINQVFPVVPDTSGDEE